MTSSQHVLDSSIATEGRLEGVDMRAGPWASVLLFTQKAGHRKSHCGLLCTYTSVQQSWGIKKPHIAGTDATVTLHTQIGCTLCTSQGLFTQTEFRINSYTL